MYKIIVLFKYVPCKRDNVFIKIVLTIKKKKLLLTRVILFLKEEESDIAMYVSETAYVMTTVAV